MTQVFNSYEEFLLREDKTVNGRSPNFSGEEGVDNVGCWNCTDCARCAGCTGCTDCARCANCARCTDCADCARCARCANCARCTGCCIRCTDCTDCDDCARCVRCANCARCTGYADCAGYFKGMPVTAVPVIEDIHKKVYEAASQPCALKMSAWHSDCGTAHCRAGWVVTLAGEEGAALEEATSTEFAAMAIYAASSDVKVSPTEFYLSNEEALEHMKELALL